MSHLEQQVLALVSALVERAVQFNWPGYPTIGFSPDKTSIVWRSPEDPSGWNTGGIVVEGQWNDGRWTAIRCQHDDATWGKEKILPWAEMLKDCIDLNTLFTDEPSHVDYFKLNSIVAVLKNLNDMAPWHNVSSNQWLKNTWMEIWSTTSFERDIVQCMFKDSSEDDWIMRVRDLAEAFNKCDKVTSYTFKDNKSKCTLRTSDIYAWAMALTWKYKNEKEFVLLPNLEGSFNKNVRLWNVLYKPECVKEIQHSVDIAVWRTAIELDSSVFTAIRSGVNNSSTAHTKTAQKYVLFTLSHAALGLTSPILKENMYEYWKTYLFNIMTHNEKLNDSIALILLTRLRNTWWSKENCPRGAALLEAFNLISPIADSVWQPGKHNAFKQLQLLEGMCTEVAPAILLEGHFDLGQY